MDKIILETNKDEVVEKLEKVREVREVFTRERIEGRKMLALKLIAIQQSIVDECDADLAKFSK